MKSFTTVSELARRDGVTRAAVQKRVKKHRVPHDSAGRVDVAAYDAAKAAGKATADTPASGGARQAYWLAKSRLMMLDLAEREGRLVPRVEVEKTLLEMTTAIKNDLRALPNKLPPLLVGQPCGEICAILAREIDDCLRHLARGAS